MRKPLIGIVLTLMLVAGAETSGAAQAAEDEAADDTAALGVSFDRIKYRLETLPDGNEAGSLLRLDFYVQVYALAPEIDYLQGFDLQNSPIAGAPMNDTMLAVMSSGEPQLRPPVMNLSNLLDWFRKKRR